jgi:hypothetical protein
LNVGPEAEDAEGEEYLVEKISDVKIAPLVENEDCGFNFSYTILVILSRNGLYFQMWMT